MELQSLNRVTEKSAVLVIAAEERIPNGTKDSDSPRQIVLAQASVSTAGES